MIVAAFWAVIKGAQWPAVMIIFGEMIDDLSNPNTLGENMVNFAYMYIGAAACKQHLNFRINNRIVRYQHFVYRHNIVSVNIIAGYFAHSFMLLAAENQCNHIRIAYFRAIMRQEIGWFDEKSSGELTTRLSR